MRGTSKSSFIPTNLLFNNPQTYTQLMNAMNMPSATLSGILEKLVDNNIIEKTIINNKPFYKLKFDDLTSISNRDVEDFEIFKETLSTLCSIRTIFLFLFKIAEKTNDEDEISRFKFLMEYADYTFEEYLDKTFKTKIGYIKEYLNSSKLLLSPVSNIEPPLKISNIDHLLKKLNQLLDEQIISQNDKDISTPTLKQEKKT